MTDEPDRGTRADANAAAPAKGISQTRFAELFQQSARSLWCIAVAVLRDHAAAHDVVQDAAMTALAKRADFDEGTSFAAWAGQIVRFTALNELRRRQRDRVQGSDAPLGFVAGPAVAAPVGGTLDPRLAAALDSLDETARTCLLMRTLMDMGYKEIAAALSIPEGTAMSHVHRSRQALRSLLAGSSVDGRAGAAAPGAAEEGRS